MTSQDPQRNLLLKLRCGAGKYHDYVIHKIHIFVFCLLEVKPHCFLACRYYLNTPKEKRSGTFIGALNDCEKTLYPLIHRFLQIGATLPVSVAPSERSFSSLRRLKTYLRNKTGEDRLNGLALLNVHRDVEVTCDEVLNEMAKMPRRMDMVL